MAAKIIYLDEIRKNSIRQPKIIADTATNIVVGTKDLKDFLFNSANDTRQVRQMHPLKSRFKDYFLNYEWLQFYVQNLLVSEIITEHLVYDKPLVIRQKPSERRFLTLRQGGFRIKTYIDNLVDLEGKKGSWTHAEQTTVGDLVDVYLGQPKEHTRILGFRNHKLYSLSDSDKINL